jgi:hypothetical protein
VAAGCWPWGWRCCSGGALAATSFAVRGTERRVTAIVPYEVRSTLIYGAPTSRTAFDAFDPESGAAPLVDLDVGMVMPLAHFAALLIDGVPRTDPPLVGDQELRVEVRAPSGEQQLVSTATGRVEDPDSPAALDLELSLLDTAIMALDNATDEDRPQVVVTATSIVAGRLAGVPFSTPVEQRLIFDVEGRRLRLLSASQPVVTTPGEVNGTVVQPRSGSVPLVGDVRLSRLRVASIILAVAGLVVADLVLVVSLLERNRGELRRARRRYGHRLVQVPPMALPPRIVDVPSMAGLARIAARLRRPILEVRGEPAVEFIVLEPGLAYCHAIRRARRTRAS